jgi:HPt (histidine-containing phosphotransfer) domain-containing protein
VAALQEAAAALAAGQLDAEALSSARADAHKLVGSLGTFGVQRGSEIARQIERELEPGRQDPARLAALATELRIVIEAS